MAFEKFISDACGILCSVLPTVLSNFVISVITAWVTVWLSLGRFRTEKWWTKKAESYSAIIEALHHMKEYCLAELKSIERSQELSSQSRDELFSKFNKGIQEVDLAADVGSFIISIEAVNLLKDFQKNHEQIVFGNDVYKYFDEQASIIDNCLDSLRKIARKDLKVK